LLIGGDKTGDGRFYERMIPIANKLYDVYLAELRKEGLIPMTGRRPFKELTKGFSPERKARVAARVTQLKGDMALHELRQARERSQEDLARELNVGQPAVAKLERRADMYVSNLRRYVEALGGSLEITARFPEGSVNITNFGELDTRSDQSSGSL
jgi:DNA-binding XRE family transcriptional regulator